jgi:hypothetical protein
MTSVSEPQGVTAGTAAHVESLARGQAGGDLREPGVHLGIDGRGMLPVMAIPEEGGFVGDGHGYGCSSRWLSRARVAHIAGTGMISCHSSKLAG